MTVNRTLSLRTCMLLILPAAPCALREVETEILACVFARSHRAGVDFGLQHAAVYQFTLFFDHGAHTATHHLVSYPNVHLLVGRDA
jgi:hypothetical protein